MSFIQCSQWRYLWIRVRFKKAHRIVVIYITVTDPQAAYFFPTLELQSPQPGPEVLSGKSLKVLLRVLWKIGVLQEVLPRVLGQLGGLQGLFSGVSNEHLFIGVCRFSGNCHHDGWRGMLNIASQTSFCRARIRSNTELYKSNIVCQACQLTPQSEKALQRPSVPLSLSLFFCNILISVVCIRLLHLMQHSIDSALHSNVSEIVLSIVTFAP